MTVAIGKKAISWKYPEHVGFRIFVLFFFLMSTLDNTAAFENITTCSEEGTLDSGIIHVDSSGEFKTIESAFECLNKKRILGDVTIEIAPGTYQPFINAKNANETKPLIIDHPEAHKITIKGQERLEIPLISFNSFERPYVREGTNGGSYGFKYNIGHRDWVLLKSKLEALNPGEKAYAIIRRTRQQGVDNGLNHFIHRGVWEIDPETIDTLDRLIVRLVYQPTNYQGVGTIPDSLDAEFDSREGKHPIAVILTTVLQFTCSSGVIVDSTHLKEIRDVVISGDYSPYAFRPPRCIGDYDPQKGTKKRGSLDPSKREWSEFYAGVEVRNGGGVKLGRYVGVTNMDGQGVSATVGSWIVADRTSASSNERRGFYPTRNAGMILTETIASGNQTDGYMADHTAELRVQSASAIGNREHGYNSIFSGRISAQTSIAALNGGTGFISKGGGSMWIGRHTGSSNSHAFRNGDYGIKIEIGGIVSTDHIKIEGNCDEDDTENKNCDHTKNRGVQTELGSIWAIDPSSVDNRDSEEIEGTLLTTPYAESTLIPGWRFFNNRADGLKAPRLEQEIFFAEIQVRIDPENPSTHLNSLYDFFNTESPYSIARKRIALPPGQMVNVELSAGIHVFRNNPLVITHPDANKVRIIGKSKPVLVAYTMNPIQKCGPDCIYVKVEFESDPEVKVGHFIAFYSSRSMFHSGWRAGQFQNHWIHRRLWQVTHLNINGDPKRVKVRNTSKATLDTHLTATDKEKIHAFVMQTVLYFPDNTAAIVVDGTTLGEIKNVVIVGKNINLDLNCDDSNHCVNIDTLPAVNNDHCIAMGYSPAYSFTAYRYGFKVQNCGYAQFNNVSVTGFEGGGFYTANNSSIGPWPYTDGYLAGPLIASTNAGQGFYASTDSAIEAKNSVSSGNGKEGYFADDRSVLYLSHATSGGNGRDGYEIRNLAHLVGTSMIAVGNKGSGFYIKNATISGSGNISQSEEPDIPDKKYSVASENQYYGFIIEDNSYAALDGAWSRKHNGENRAGFHFSGSSYCRCNKLKIYFNEYPIKAMSSSLIKAGDNTECRDNNYSQYIQTSSNPPANIIGGCNN